VETTKEITVLVSAIAELDGVANREIILAQPAPTESEAEAFYFLECVLVFSWFHSNEERLTHIIGGSGIPVAMTDSGRLIAFNGTDFPYWTETTSSLAREFSMMCTTISRSTARLDCRQRGRQQSSQARRAGVEGRHRSPGKPPAEDPVGTPSRGGRQRGGGILNSLNLSYLAATPPNRDVNGRLSVGSSDESAGLEW